MQHPPSRQTLPENTLIYLGKSMNPTFTDLDLLTYSAPNGPVRPGDVIAFRRSPQSRIVIHRVISTDGGVIVTQGDSNALPDPYTVERCAVIGVIRSRQRDRRHAPVLGGSQGPRVFPVPPGAREGCPALRPARAAMVSPAGRAQDDQPVRHRPDTLGDTDHHPSRGRRRPIVVPRKSGRRPSPGQPPMAAQGSISGHSRRGEAAGARTADGAGATRGVSVLAGSANTLRETIANRSGTGRGRMPVLRPRSRGGKRTRKARARPECLRRRPPRPPVSPWKSPLSRQATARRPERPVQSHNHFQRNDKQSVCSTASRAVSTS